MSSCVGLVYLKSSCIKTTASGLSYYELGVNGEKKLMETGILIKMDIAHLTSWHCYVEIDWRWESVSKKTVMVNYILQMICIIGYVLEAPGPY